MSGKNNKYSFDEEKYTFRNESSNLNSNKYNNSSKPNSINNSSWKDSYNNDEDSLDQIQQKIGKTENESLASTQRTLRMLYDTEEVGIKTAEELNRQGEKLNNMNRNLDDVNQTLNESQKNINSVKSLFGGLKNKFKLKNRSTKVKKIEEKQFSNSKSFDEQPHYQSQHSKPEFVKITGSDRETEMNKNLEDISLGLTRLTDLATGMSKEMDKQMPVLDIINEKTGTTNDRIKKQNEQMKKVI